MLSNDYNPNDVEAIMRINKQSARRKYKGQKSREKSEAPQREQGSANPETGHCQKEKPIMPLDRNLDRLAGRDVIQTPEGQELKRKDYDPYKEKYGDMSRWRDDWKGRMGQEAAKAGGKLAGSAIAGAAENWGIIGSVMVYGLALLNDLPDLAEPIIAFLTVGTGVIVDFLFDLIVVFGFRYFLRQYINIPGMKWIVYGSGIAELIPIVGVLPFWTLCAWLAMRKINQEKEIQQAMGVSRGYAGRERQLALERKYAAYNQNI